MQGTGSRSQLSEKPLTPAVCLPCRDGKPCACRTRVLTLGPHLRLWIHTWFVVWASVGRMQQMLLREHSSVDGFWVKAQFHSPLDPIVSLFAKLSSA